MQQLQNTTLTSVLAHREPLIVGGLVVLAHLALRAADRILIGAFNDDGAYVALGKALAGGLGYRLIYLVGDPVAVKYPPGLPLLIAVPWKLFGTLAGVRATIALLNPLASGAAAGMIWWIGRRRLGAAPAVLGLCAVGPFFLDALIQYFNIPLSEPYFVCGWATALLLAYRLSDAGPGAARPALAVTLGLVLALTALFRTAGVVTLAAVLVALVLERRPWREVALCAGVALVPHARHATRQAAQGRRRVACRACGRGGAGAAVSTARRNPVLALAAARSAVAAPLLRRPSAGKQRARVLALPQRLPRPEPLRRSDARRGTRSGGLHGWRPRLASSPGARRHGRRRPRDRSAVAVRAGPPAAADPAFRGAACREHAPARRHGRVGHVAPLHLRAARRRGPDRCGAASGAAARR